MVEVKIREGVGKWKSNTFITKRLLGGYGS